MRALAREGVYVQEDSALAQYLRDLRDGCTPAQRGQQPLGERVGGREEEEVEERLVVDELGEEERGQKKEKRKREEEEDGPWTDHWQWLRLLCCVLLPRVLCRCWWSMVSAGNRERFDEAVRGFVRAAAHGLRLVATCQQVSMGMSLAAPPPPVARLEGRCPVDQLRLKRVRVAWRESVQVVRQALGGGAAGSSGGQLHLQPLRDLLKETRVCAQTVLRDHAHCGISQRDKQQSMWWQQLWTVVQKDMAMRDGIHVLETEAATLRALVQEATAGFDTEGEELQREQAQAQAQAQESTQTRSRTGMADALASKPVADLLEASTRMRCDAETIAVRLWSWQRHLLRVAAGSGPEEQHREQLNALLFELETLERSASLQATDASSTGAGCVLAQQLARLRRQVAATLGTCCDDPSLTCAMASRGQIPHAQESDAASMTQKSNGIERPLPVALVDGVHETGTETKGEDGREAERDIHEHTAEAVDVFVGQLDAVRARELQEAERQAARRAAQQTEGASAAELHARSQDLLHELGHAIGPKRQRAERLVRRDSHGDLLVAGINGETEDEEQVGGGGEDEQVEEEQSTFMFVDGGDHCYSGPGTDAPPAWRRPMPMAMGRRPPHQTANAIFMELQGAVPSSAQASATVVASES